MTKKPVRKVKPVKAWALLYDGEIKINHIYAFKQTAVNNLQFWSGDPLTGPIRVTITPAPRKK